MAEPTHEVYGDESVFNNAVVYGVVVVPISSTPKLEVSISSLKEKNGIQGNTDIHCKQMFHQSAKQKTGWAQLGDQEIEKLFSDIVIESKRLGSFYQIGFIDKRQWPKILPADDKFPETPLDDKHLCGFAFQGAIAPLESSVGIPNIRLFVDYDHTKIPWFGKQRQAYRNYRGWSGISKQWIEPEPKPETKPILLELADIVAYVSTHALCVQEYASKPMFERLYQVIGPRRNIFNPKV